MRRSNMFYAVIVFLMISYCSGDTQEMHCSRYHYEEQILAKIVRMEYRIEQLENKSNEKGVTSTDSKCAQCPDTWIPFRGSCYLFVDDKRSFYEAAIHCSKLNAYLVHVESEIENIFLKSQLKGLKEDNYWMGLTDIDKEGEFKWYGTDKLASFTDWIGGQPDNAGGQENCVHFYCEQHGCKWNDVPCNREIKAICEMKQY